MRIFRLMAASGLLTILAVAAGEDPWKPSDLMPPATLASRLADATASKPVILFIGFEVLYHGAHIPNAVYVGAASKPEGLEALRKAVAGLARNKEIVIYCGCCPFDRCPNVRPAFAELRRLGFEKISVLSLPSNTATDWIGKGYPVERPSGVGGH